jgi:hypothetical protein
MSTLPQLIALEKFMRTTTLRGQDALDAFHAHPMHLGEQTIPVHKPRVSADAACARIDRELAECQFTRQHGYFRPCLATMRDIKRIEANYGDDVQVVVAELVKIMEASA